MAMASHGGRAEATASGARAAGHAPVRVGMQPGAGCVNNGTEAEDMSMEVKKMRLLAVGGLAVAAAGVGLVWMVRGGDGGTAVEETKKEPSEYDKKLQQARRNMLSEAPRQEEASTRTEVIVPLRDIDREILQIVYASNPESRRDALPKATAQVNIRVSPKTRSVERVEIDLNRDGRIDERWTIGPNVRRMVSLPDSPLRDDYVLDADSWRLVSGKGATIAVEPATPEQVAENVAARELRPVDKKILALLGGAVRPGVQTIRVDGRDVQVSVKTRPDGSSIRSISVDLDGDSKWDETWTVRGAGKIRRHVTTVSEEDGRVRERYALVDGMWTKL
jgi:hypothetical protein